MEFTKRERRLLDVSLAHEKRDNRALLALGILCAVIGIGLLTYGYLVTIPSVEATFRELETSTSMIQVTTKHEETLKQMLLKMSQQITKDQKEIAERMTNSAGFSSLWIAIICISASYWSRTYRSLIRKLKSSAPSPD